MEDRLHEFLKFWTVDAWEEEIVAESTVDLSFAFWFWGYGSPVFATSLL